MQRSDNPKCSAGRTSPLTHAPPATLHCCASPSTFTFTSHRCSATCRTPPSLGWRRQLGECAAQALASLDKVQRPPRTPPPQQEEREGQCVLGRNAETDVRFCLFKVSKAHKPFLHHWCISCGVPPRPPRPSRLSRVRRAGRPCTGNAIRDVLHRLKVGLRSSLIRYNSVRKNFNLQF